MAHELEKKYGLSATELLDALNRRFRARVTLEGAVAEVQMAKKITALCGSVVERFENHDIDGHPDFSIWIKGFSQPLLAECKNVRDSEEAYRKDGQIIAYKVETQKTRASQGDPVSRYYGLTQFHILGVCLGKKSGDWSDFGFIRVSRLQPHPKYASKLAVMQRVPISGEDPSMGWFSDLGTLLKEWVQ